MSLKTAAEKPEEHCFVFVEFSGPGSVRISNMEVSPTVIPAQIMALASILETEGKGAYIEQRNQLVAQMADVRNKVLRPKP